MAVQPGEGKLTAEGSFYGKGTLASRSLQGTRESSAASWLETDV